MNPDDPNYSTEPLAGLAPDNLNPLTKEQLRSRVIEIRQIRMSHLTARAVIANAERAHTPKAKVEKAEFDDLFGEEEVDLNN